MMNTSTLENKIEHLVTESTNELRIKKPANIPFALKVARFGFNSLGRVFPDKASELALEFFKTPRLRARHKRSDDLIEAAKVSDLIINDTKIKTYEWGDGKQTILLAHGWESRGTALRAYVPSFLEQGYKVVAFDAPAHGDSGGKQTDLFSFSETVRVILEQNTPIHGIVAHSFGGPASMFALTRMKASFPVAKVVFVACPSAVSVPVKRAAKIMNLPSKVTAKFVERLEQIIQLPLENVTVPYFAKSIDVKQMLIIHDIHDDIVPIDSAIANNKAFAQSQLLTTEGVGHTKILKDKQVIDRIANFMAEK